MAIKLCDYIKIETNIYRHIKKINKFLFIYKINNIQKRKIYIIDEKPMWNTRSYLIAARTKKEELYKNTKEELRGKKLNCNITLNQLFEMFFQTQDISKKWNKTRQTFYLTNIKDHLGNRAIDDISPYDLDKLIQDLIKQGKANRTALTVLQILSPMFNMAKKNNAIISNPCQNVNFTFKKKKIYINNPIEQFMKLYITFYDLYKDNPFYRALFLLALTGRRKSEILNLKWEDIDFNNNTILLRHTKNNNPYKINLYKDIKEALLQIPSFLIIKCQFDYIQKGYVFINHKSGKQIKNIDRHYKNIRKASGLDSWYLHQTRHIWATMANQMGADNAVVSNTLLHSSQETTKIYLSDEQLTATKKAELIWEEVKNDYKNNQDLKLDLIEREGEEVETN